MSAEIFAAFRWWLVLLAVGTAALPITMRTFAPLPDRGYAFSKMVGLLLLSYLYWLLAALGILHNNAGGLLAAVVLVLCFSGFVYVKYGRTEEFGSGYAAWIRANWRYVLTVELLFAVVFAAWTWVRAQNPAITATEKPMEFAFLNSAVRSEQYPPLDPWLSGFAISYYYFGYVMTSIITKLAMVNEAIAFNLGIAWLIAGTAVGSFGLVYNLIASHFRRWRRQALVFGLVAALAIPVAGNLEILLELAHANGVGSASFWEWLDVRDLSGPAAAQETPRYETSQWWWWRSSRVIHEYHLSGRSEEGLEPIAEFPGFSFVLGDMHPHVLALPFVFPVLAVASLWWQRDHFPSLYFLAWFRQKNARQRLRDFTTDDWWLLAATAIGLGGLAFLNTWDVLIHLFVVLGAFLLAKWRIHKEWSSQLLTEAFYLGVLLTLLAILLYIPFYLGFRSQAGPPFLLPMTMRPTRLAHFLVIFGMPLVAIMPFLVALMLSYSRGDHHVERGGHLLKAAALPLVLSLLLLVLALFLGWLIGLSGEGAVRIVSLANELEIPLAVMPEQASLFFRVRWSAASIALLLPAFLTARLQFGALNLFLIVLASAVIYALQRAFIRRETHSGSSDDALSASTIPFVLLLILTATLLALGPEFVYLKDVFGQRLNTIFKFYYQSWVLFGTVALFSLAYLLYHRRLAGVLTAILYSGLLIISLAFPYYAVRSRAVEYRGPAAGDDRRPATLNGLAYLQSTNPDEYEAILWLKDHAGSSATIVEAVGGQYSGYARVSANTGIPTILGWAGHEYQWRGDTPEPPIRETDVATIYNQTSWESVSALLDRYGIDYVYYGGLERSTYEARDSEMFDRYLNVAFQNDTVKIYSWTPDAND